MIKDPFPASDFDAWAETYDESILNNSAFPFNGYLEAIDLVVQLSQAESGQRVLDLGTGTGILASRFAQLGCRVWATDFSRAMLEIARKRLPQVVFGLHDLRQPWLVEWHQPFDIIVSGYVFHHFEDLKKFELVKEFVTQHLVYPTGKMIIADISFENQTGWQEARQIAGSEWDEEYYWTAQTAIDELRKLGLQVCYNPVSYCAGVYQISLP